MNLLKNLPRIYCLNKTHLEFNLVENKKCKGHSTITVFKQFSQANLPLVIKQIVPPQTLAIGQCCCMGLVKIQKPKQNTLKIVHTSPNCQDFSRSGNYNTNHGNPKYFIS